MSAHRLILAAASPLLKEAMSQDLQDQVVILVPEVTSGVMTSILDLVYKGRMNITPTSTWAIRSLVEILRINAEDVSVISGGAKKPALTLIQHQESRVHPITTNATSTPLKDGGGGDPASGGDLRRAGRKRKQITSPQKVPVKAARGMYVLTELWVRIFYFECFMYLPNSF